MLLRSRMHCLSLCDNPNTGTGGGRKGMPPRLLSTNECRKFDKTLCGGPAMEKENSSKQAKENALVKKLLQLWPSYLFHVAILLSLLLFQQN